MVFLPQTKFNRFGLFALALAGLVVLVGVLAVPTPEKAWAVNLPCKVVVNWGQCAPYNIQATAQLLDSEGEPIGGWFAIQLKPDEDMVTFSGTFVAPPTTAALVRFNWVVEGGYAFVPPPVQIIEINSVGTTAIDTGADCNW